MIKKGFGPRGGSLFKNSSYILLTFHVGGTFPFVVIISNCRAAFKSAYGLKIKQTLKDETLTQK
jgi:hypothetical protein